MYCTGLKQRTPLLDRDKNGLKRGNEILKIILKLERFHTKVNSIQQLRIGNDVSDDPYYLLNFYWKTFF